MTSCVCRSKVSANLKVTGLASKPVYKVNHVDPRFLGFHVGF